jgi:hypothetical protein
VRDSVFPHELKEWSEARRGTGFSASVSPCLRGEAFSVAFVFAVLLGCATEEKPPEPAPTIDVRPTCTGMHPDVPPKELPFDPSPDDKAALGAAGFVGVANVPPETGFAKGPKIAGTTPGGGLEAAGLKENDVIVKFAGVTFRADDDDPIGTFRKRLLELPPDSDTQLTYWREKEGVREVTFRLGRQPPPFANLDTPADWLAPVPHDDAVAKLIADAVALDHGEARYADVVARNRKHLSKTDSFRLKEVTQAHLDLAANEMIARELSADLSAHPYHAAWVAGGVIRDFDYALGPLFTNLNGKSLPELTDVAAALVQEGDEWIRREALASWSSADREYVAKNFHLLTDRINEGEYLYDDPQVARERSNRHLLQLLSAVNRAKVAEAAELVMGRLQVLAPALAAAAEKDGRDGLLIAKDTPAGRIEIWGRGDTRHTTRCAFCFDLAGDDDWVDCAGAADLDHPVSITIDWSGNDTYTSTSPFSQGGALGGIGILWDHAGDDEYVARTWSQGCGVAGLGLLMDDGGRDVYHGQEECQGVGFAGAGVLVDGGNDDDLYTGVRFCQGVGFPGGVGALIEKGGNDRYVCTGRYDSEYGEPGLFSGWGQGVGFGFRNIASGGIGILYDLAGDDVYEAGNFSQGGGYFYGWGILRDDAGNDRYIGSRYAQGFAAHQAVGTFLDGCGNDLYQCHSSVADGISWDETSVVFHDMGGDDVYERSGQWLAGAAMNGMVLFRDDGGNDRFEALPAHAASNEYHGGHSFALFVHRGGDATYGDEKHDDWHDRVFWRDDGAYFLDLPENPKPLSEYVR